MTTMTDEAAIKIAEKTIDKYSKAGRKALIMYYPEEGNDGIFDCLTTKDGGEFWLRTVVSSMEDFLGDDFGNVMKSIVKDWKKEKKDAKRKKNA